jgi:G3E family GTPase
VNKVDLVSPEALATLRARLARLNPRALQLESVRGALDADVLFATDVAVHRARTADPRPASGHLTADGFGSFVYRSRLPLAKPDFERVLAALPADLVRAKGIVRLVDRDWHCLFNVTCGRVELGWLKLGDAADENQAVFIGRHAERHRAAVLAALAACER